MPIRKRKGFTILELILALALSAGLLIAGRALIEHVVGIGEALAVNAAVADTTRLRARTLRAIARNIDAGSDALIFFGDGNTAQFVSWCRRDNAVKERCAISLTVDSAVTLADSSGYLVLMRHGTPGVLRYLGDSRDGGHWYRSWGPGITLPLAIGIIFRTDTTVLRIGDRG